MTTTTIDTIRGDLQALIEQLEPVRNYRLDELVESYVGRYGLRRFSQLDDGMVPVLHLLSEHRVEQLPVDRSCPPWCELEPGHRWDSIESATGRELRGHGRHISPHADLWQQEYADEPGPAGRPSLSITVDEVRDWTSTEARQLAAELLNAADELDKVTR